MPNPISRARRVAGRLTFSQILILYTARREVRATRAVFAHVLYGMASEGSVYVALSRLVAARILKRTAKHTYHLTAYGHGIWNAQARQYERAAR